MKLRLQIWPARNFIQILNEKRPIASYFCQMLFYVWVYDHENVKKWFKMANKLSKIFAFIKKWLKFLGLEILRITFLFNFKTFIIDPSFEKNMQFIMGKMVIKRGSSVLSFPPRLISSITHKKSTLCNAPIKMLQCTHRKMHNFWIITSSTWKDCQSIYIRPVDSQ